MSDEIKINDKGLEIYPISTVIFGNIIMLLIMFFGTIAVWYLLKWWALLYTITFFVMIYFVLRKVVCSNCYYYDGWCALGWGKLSIKMSPFHDINVVAFPQGKKTPLGVLRLSFHAIYPTN